MHFRIIDGKNNDVVVRNPGKYVYFVFNHSGKVNIKIESSNATVKIFGVYIGHGNDKFRLNTVQHHLKRQSQSDLLIKGVFFDYCNFEYNGLIRIERQAYKTNAYQKNQNLVVSGLPQITSKPDLEILADDVRCTHGSTTGTLNEEQLYYLMTRGLDEKAGRSILLEGFVSDIFDQMANMGLAGQIESLRLKCMRYLNKLKK